MPSDRGVGRGEPASTLDIRRPRGHRALERPDRLRSLASLGQIAGLCGWHRGQEERHKKRASHVDVTRG
jgi:hypothetical protein